MPLVRQRLFLLLLSCALVTSLAVLLLPTSRHTAATSHIHSLVRQTQVRISSAMADSRPSLPAPGPALLARLGLTSQSQPARSPGPPPPPLLLSAVHPGQTELALGFLQSAQHFTPELGVQLYEVRWNSQCTAIHMLCRWG